MKQYIWLTILILIAQILLTVFVGLTHYFVVAILPAIILFLPIRTSTPVALVLAFFVGIIADLGTSEVVGITSISLLPLALLRFKIIALVFGEDVISRSEDVTLARNGTSRCALAITVSLIIYLSVFIWADSAGVRTFSFNLLRFAISLALDTILCLISAAILTSKNFEKWN